MSIRVFLCHSSGDKSSVRILYRRLQDLGYSPWLDEEDLLPGQDWEMEIRKAVREADVVVVCLSRSSIHKSGFVQKEIRHALDVADEQPEGAIFVIPVLLEECEVPERLRKWQWVNLNGDNGYDKLDRSLQHLVHRTTISAGAKAPADQQMRTDEKLIGRCRELVASELGVELRQITTGTSLTRDLGADSLDLLEVGMRLEEEFEIAIPDEHCSKFDTFGDLIAYLRRFPGLTPT